MGNIEALLANIYFNPRSPRGERRARPMDTPITRAISIPAPREGSDSLSEKSLATDFDFNPRSPRGERPQTSTKKKRIIC